MTFNQLRTFVEVARRGSVTGAAAALFVTEPSVSAAIAALQEEIGVPLVRRAGRGIELTAAGEVFAGHAAELLGLAERARRAAQEAAGRPGVLRIAAVTTAGEYVLPPLLAAFRARSPEVQVVLQVANRAQAFAALEANEVDLAIGGRPPAGGRIKGEPVLDSELVLVAGPRHPLSRKRTIEPHTLSAETWLLREDGSGTREATEAYLAAHEIEPAATMVIGSNAAIKRAVAAGLGITLMQLDAVAGEIAARELSRIRAPGTPLKRSWHVLYRDADALPPSSAAFLALLRSPAARRVLRT